MSDRKLSALTHAAQISPLVNKLTIGPAARESQDSSTAAVAKECSVTSAESTKQPQVPPVESKWRKDVWRSVRDADKDDDDDDDNTSRSKSTNRTTILTLIDCKAVSFKMALRTAERNRQTNVRQQMLERQKRQDEQLTQLMAKMKVASDSVPADDASAEQALLGTIAALRRMDEDGRRREEQTARELAENRQRQLERFDHLRRDDELHECCEQIKSQKNLFIMLYERFVKVLLMAREQLASAALAEYQQKQGEFFVRYESLINRVNSGRISMEEVAVLEQLCDDIKATQISVETDVQQNADELEKIHAADLAEAKSRQEAAAAAAAAEMAQKEEELRKTMLAAQAAATVQAPQLSAVPPPTYVVDNVDNGGGGGGGIKQFVSAERLQHYEQIMTFYEQYAQSVKPLQADERMKEYRFFCQKAINTPLNSISAVSAEHLQETFVRLGCFLAGTPVKVGDVDISSTAHPLGIRFCNLLVAKKLVVSSWF